MKAKPPAASTLDQSQIGQILGYQLAQASILPMKIFKRNIGEPFSLSKVEFSLLMLLAANPTVSAKQLSATLNIPASNMTPVLSKLEERKLLTRSRSADDGRVSYVKLTGEGARLVKKLGPIARAMESELLTILSAAEQAMLFELLRKISAHRRI